MNYVNRTLGSIRLTGPIRIGCKDASGFVFIGSASDLNLDELDKLTRSKMVSLSEKAVKEARTVKESESRMLEKIKQLIVRVEEFCEWKPFAERKIVDAYKSICNDDLILIVEGNDQLVEFEPITSREDLEAIPEERYKDLAEALYKSQIKELRRTYQLLLEDDNPTMLGVRRKNVQKIEAWLREDPYGLLEDPDGLIESVRKLVAKEYDEKEAVR